ncbi:hypothetical protein CsSME_00033270 [Camellia sinensis var. sinensis]
MLVDQDMTLMTSFLKSKEDGSGYGGDWAVRIDVQSEKSKLSEVMQTVHRFFYLANEDGNALSLSRETLNIRENSLLAFGSQTDVGSLNLNLELMDDLEVHYSGIRTSHIHNLSDLVQQNLGAQFSAVVLSLMLCVCARALACSLTLLYVLLDEEVWSFATLRHYR